ncbi:hypothetical protein SALBM135S_05915 [Streptomyces alboniger]
MAAVSMLRYPASRAVVTADSASSSGTCQTPKPSWGISTPLFRMIGGTLLDELSILRFVGWYFHGQRSMAMSHS